jgi:hypothetical protein
VRADERAVNDPGVPPERRCLIDILPAARVRSCRGYPTAMAPRRRLDDREGNDLNGGDVPKTSRSKQAGRAALDRLQASIEAAETALKDLRGEVSRDSRELLADVGTTLKDARRNLSRSRKQVVKDLEQIEQALVKGKTARPAAKPAGAARPRTAARPSTARSTGTRRTRSTRENVSRAKTS